MDKPHFSLSEILRAVEIGQTATGAAQALGCSTDTIRNYRRRWKSVDDAILSKRRELVDLAESGLYRAINRDEAWAIAFTLKTLGRDDGYAERIEHTGVDGGDILIREIVIERPKLLAEVREDRSERAAAS